MSKKSRRQRRLNLPPEAYNNPVATAPAPRTAAATPVAPTVTAPRGTVPANWQDEYSDVLGDLKRTGILAAAIMAGMIALSFVIH